MHLQVLCGYAKKRVRWSQCSVARGNYEAFQNGAILDGRLCPGIEQTKNSTAGGCERGPGISRPTKDDHQPMIFLP